MINTVLFDLDGTLLDTLGDITDSVNYMLRQFSLEEKSLEEVKKCIGGGMLNLIERIMPKRTNKHTLKKAIECYKQYYCDNLIRHTKPYNGIPQLLEKLRLKNFNLAVVSNKTDTTVKQLCAHFFKGLIDCAVGDDYVRPLKPNPASLKYAMARMDVLPPQCIMVGDSDADIKAAKSCSIPCAAVTWGYKSKEFLLEFSPDFILSKPEDFIEEIISGEGQK